MTSLKSNQYRNTNRALISSVNKEMFKVSWDVDSYKYPRILLHPADFGGCGHYRLLNPAKEMEIKNNIQVYATNILMKPHELGRFNADSMITQRQVLDGQIQYLHRSSTLNGVNVVYDLDDLLDNVQDKNIHKKDFNQRHFNNLYKALSIVDRMICSTEFLKEWHSKYCKDIVVCHNRLRPSVWGNLKSQRAVSERPRVGWAGGFSHAGDLEIIIDTVKELYKEVDFVFLGYVHPEMEKYIKEYHSGVKYEMYQAKLASLNLDLALAPLEDVPFNHAKSHIKVLEYGAVGIPVVATDISPYKNFPITYPKTNDSKGFTDAIREVLSDRDAMYKMGDNLQEFVRNNWFFDDASIDHWQNAWLLK
jgi:glycosyltransferase involved in cell wall biosynthesis